MRLTFYFEMLQQKPTALLLSQYSKCRVKKNKALCVGGAAVGL